MTEATLEIPKRTRKENQKKEEEEPSLIHHQVAIRFGKTFSADMPSYREWVKKIEAGTHVHVCQK